MGPGSNLIWITSLSRKQNSFLHARRSQGHVQQSLFFISFSESSQIDEEQNDIFRFPYGPLGFLRVPQGSKEFVRFPLGSLMFFRVPKASKGALGLLNAICLFLSHQHSSMVKKVKLATWILSFPWVLQIIEFSVILLEIQDIYYSHNFTIRGHCFHK